ncbi:MAG: GNAT family N-acetyltransferase [Pseudomonadota bacterium]
MAEETDPVIERGFAEEDRTQVATLCWEAFSGKLSRILGPKDRAVTFVASVLNPDFGVVARMAGRVQGVAGWKTAHGQLVGGDLPDLQRVYGSFGGLWRGLCLAPLERQVEDGILLMDGICVAPEARGRGLGTALLRAVRERARADGLRRVRLDVVDSNPRARALYEREGFRPVGTSRSGLAARLYGFKASTRMDASV